MKYVNQPVRKTDAMSLVTGKPVYTDDLAPRDCLIVKILRSPHANAWVEDIKTGTAEKVAGIACVLTYKDVPQKRFTLAGQTAPEMSPDDRLILDRHVLPLQMHISFFCCLRQEEFSASSHPPDGPGSDYLLPCGYPEPVSPRGNLRGFSSMLYLPLLLSHPQQWQKIIRSWSIRRMTGN